MGVVVRAIGLVAHEVSARARPVSDVLVVGLRQGPARVAARTFRLGTDYIIFV